MASLPFPSGKVADDRQLALYLVTNGAPRVRRFHFADKSKKAVTVTGDRYKEAREGGKLSGKAMQGAFAQAEGRTRISIAEEG
jgi:hypothetical protein